MEPYLSKVESIRLSDHRLETESGRYHRPRKELEDRKCQTYDVLEDEDTVF